MTAASIPQPQYSSQVSRSTDEDMRVIHAWLQEQDKQHVHGTFLCNWSLTEKHHRAGDLLVYRHEDTGEPIAYQWGDLIRPGILEVRAGMRSRGVGKRFVSHLLALACDANEDVLIVQCAPESSIPFWQRMGFSLVAGTEPTEAVRIVRRRLPLSTAGQPVDVRIEWYPESRRWNDATPPVSVYMPDSRLIDGELHLAERAACGDRVEGKEVVLRIVVQGEQWYLDKAKYEKAAALGVRACTNGYYIDVIRRGAG